MRKLLTQRLTQGEATEAEVRQAVIDLYPDGIREELAYALRNNPNYLVRLLNLLADLWSECLLLNSDGTVTTVTELEAVVRQEIPGLKLIIDKETEEAHSMAKNKEFRELIEELPRQGWALTQTSQGHWRAVPPDKTQTVVHFSETDDSHGRKNILRDLRVRGLKWPPLSKNDQAGATRFETVEPLAHVAGTTRTTSLAPVEVRETIRSPPHEPPPSPPRKIVIDMHAPKYTANQAPEVVNSFKALSASADAAARNYMDPDERALEDIIHALKDAKLVDRLAGEILQQAKEKVEAATRELQRADAEKNKAAEDLAKKKAAFDKAFEAS